MIEIKHTRPDGSEWIEWVPEESGKKAYLCGQPVEEIKDLTSEGLLKGLARSRKLSNARHEVVHIDEYIRRAEFKLKSEWRDAKAAIKRLDLSGAARHAKATWQWAKEITKLKRGR